MGICQRVFVIFIFFAVTAPAIGVGIVVDGKRVIVGGENCSSGAALAGFQADGTPVCTCLSGFTQCTDTCVSLMTDPANCGACDSTCSQEEACVQGHCRACDLITQSCPDSGEACFAMLLQDKTACFTPYPENDSGMQGDDCQYFNGCAEGFGCVLDTTYSGILECARFCDIDRSYPTCESEVGAGFRCVRASDFYSNVEADDIAFCVGPEWFLPTP